jgi:hypothetical protein
MGEGVLVSVVADILKQRYIVVRNQLKGAEKRLVYAHSQVRNEEVLVEEYAATLHEIAEGLASYGGDIPEDEPDEHGT